MKLLFLIISALSATLHAMEYPCLTLDWKTAFAFHQARQAPSSSWKFYSLRELSYEDLVLKLRDDKSFANKTLRDACGWLRDNIILATMALENGADITHKDRENNEVRTPVQEAAYYGHLHIVQLLLARGADQEHALLGAAEGNRVHILQYLLKQGCNVNAAIEDWPKKNVTALMVAAMYNKFEAAEFLLKNGAHVNLQDSNGFTSLHCTAWYDDDPRMIQLLLDYGADVTIQTGKKATTLDFAQERNHTKAIECLS